MKQCKHFLLYIIFLSATLTSNAQAKTKVLPEDLSLFRGRWTGSLTYLDYKSNKPYTILSDIDITWDGKSGKLLFSFVYPKEPQANAVDTVAISNDGQYFDEAKVISRRQLENGTVEIVTQTTGKDGNENKDALIKRTYTLSETSYKTRKDVQFAGETTWIKRNESFFTKRKGNN